jgi:hypothetical protein
MKILLLDMDGVLNSANYLHTKPRESMPFEHINPEAVAILNRIVRETGCKIVISSSWRVILPWWVLRMVLACRGFKFVKSVIGETPRGAFDNRGMEIASWLNKHPEVERFVIVDDDADMAHLMPNLVQTSWHSGLDGVHAAEIICRLTREQASVKLGA